MHIIYIYALRVYVCNLDNACAQMLYVLVERVRMRNRCWQHIQHPGIIDGAYGDYIDGEWVVEQMGV